MHAFQAKFTHALMKENVHRGGFLWSASGVFLQQQCFHN